MTTQAKNRTLAYIVMAMLALVVIVSQRPESTNSSVTIMLPKDQPVLVVIEEPSIDEAEFECLRTNLYFEAGDQTVKGMEAVALVTLNRTKTKHYPGTVCEVVKAYAVVKSGRKVCQFSWYCDGKTDVPNLANTLERKAWDKATRVATAAMEGKIKDFLGRATHYHANYVNPDWANVPKRYRRLTSVGTHIFYRDIALKLKHST